MLPEPQPMPGDGHTCVLPFDTDDPTFARGFEAGRLWQRLHLDDAAVDETIHATNTEMALRMAQATGRHATGEIIDDTWTIVRFTESATIEIDVPDLPRPDTP